MPAAIYLESPIAAELERRVRKLAFEQQLIVQCASKGELNRLWHAARFARLKIKKRVIKVLPRPTTLTIYIWRLGRDD